MRTRLRTTGNVAFLLFVATLLCGENRAQAAPEVQATYSVRHSLNVTDIPQGAKKVRIWFWLPQDDAAQKVLNLAITDAPAGSVITRDPSYGRQYLYCEVNAPTQTSVALTTDFLLTRRAISIALDPEKSVPLSEANRRTFAEYLEKVTPNMEVDTNIAELAAKICGNDDNTIRQARKIYDYVIDNTEHYSKGDTAPKPSKIGSVAYCRANGGGSCTDMHSLFSALARARNIPTRLYFGSRLQAKNEGKEVDPGYRCSVEFFAPNYGWVPVEIAAADTNPEKRDFYFGGIDERRVVFNEGRNFDLAPRQDGPRLNLFIGAYVEIDGKPCNTWSRSMKFNESAVSKVAQTLTQNTEIDRSGNANSALR